MSATSKPVVVGVADQQSVVVRYAVAEAQRLGRSLRVVHCWPMPAVGVEWVMGADSTELTKDDGKVVLDHARAVVAEMSPELDVEYVVAYGSPASILIDQGREAAELVLGADDLPWFERFLGGELSAHLARAAQCPVVVVPEQIEPGSADGGVVVSIEGHSSASGPLRYGFEQADLRQEPLHVLHAVPAGTIGADLEIQRANVAEIIAGWGEQFPGVEVLRSTTDGARSDACIQATSRASLVVMGRHHGRTTPLTLLRPIASTVLRGAQCPVVVVPLDYGRVAASSATA